MDEHRFLNMSNKIVTRSRNKIFFLGVVNQLLLLKNRFGVWSKAWFVAYILWKKCFPGTQESPWLSRIPKRWHKGISNFDLNFAAKSQFISWLWGSLEESWRLVISEKIRETTDMTLRNQSRHNRDFLAHFYAPCQGSFGFWLVGGRVRRTDISYSEHSLKVSVV